MAPLIISGILAPHLRLPHRQRLTYRSQHRQFLHSLHSLTRWILRLIGSLVRCMARGPTSRRRHLIISPPGPISSLDRWLHLIDGGDIKHRSIRQLAVSNSEHRIQRLLSKQIEHLDHSSGRRGHDIPCGGGSFAQSGYFENLFDLRFGFRSRHTGVGVGIE